MQNKPVTVGITGGIGAGKTLVCQMFSILGVPIYNADNRARTLMVENLEVKASLIANFGSVIYTESGVLNRSYLAGIVFKDKRKLKILNSIVHPAVADDFEKWVAANNHKKYIMKEAALLLETGAEEQLDQIITIVAPEKVREQRVMRRDPQRSTSEIRRIMQEQLPDEEKVKRSDYVITNDGDSLLIPQVLLIHEKLLNFVLSD